MKLIDISALKALTWEKEYRTQCVVSDDFNFKTTVTINETDYDYRIFKGCNHFTLICTDQEVTPNVLARISDDRVRILYDIVRANVLDESDLESDETVETYFEGYLIDED